MTMSATTLKNGLANMAPTTAEAEAMQRLADAWHTYFSAAAAGAVPFIPSTPPKDALIAALAGMSMDGAGAAKIQAGILAYWGVLAATPATYFAGATVIVPPSGLAGIAAALVPIFAANTTGNLSLSDAAQAVANALHAANSGGTATLPGPLVVTIT